MNDLEHVVQVQVYPQDKVLGVEVLRQRVLLALAILTDISKLPFTWVIPNDFSATCEGELSKHH